jgi:predicted glycoside hydrolase/deacetylase ChbG (UPF0249 family)
MPTRLIVNADDFGLTPGINRAIGELHSAGVLTSATLMANGPAFDDAIAVARNHPTLGVGCHIVLTDGIPLAAPQHIPTLLGPDRKSLRPSLVDFSQAILRGKIKSSEIELEALLQIHKLQQSGIPITHIDTHKHTHIFPLVCEQLLALAESNNIPAIRNPFEPSFAMALKHGSRIRRLALQAIGRFRPGFEARIKALNGKVDTTNGTIAISATGQLNATTLTEILAALPNSGTYELCCHPGYNDPDLSRITTRLRIHRNTEREALLTEIPRTLTGVKLPRLVTYASLPG